MKKLNIWVWLIPLACLCACSQNAANKGKESDVENLTPKKLVVADTLVALYEDFPTSLDVRENRLCVTMVKSDTCLALYDKSSGKLVKRLGVKGSGPHDMKSPEFVRNGRLVDDSRFAFYDLNHQKMFLLNKEGELGDFSPLQSRWGALNVTPHYVVGHSVEFDPTLFLMKDRNTEEVTSFELYPKLPDALTERFKTTLRYIYSSHVMCNEAQNAIVLPMYFFDMIQVYNFKGELQKVITLGEEKNFEAMFRTLTADKDYWGYSSTYATEDFCYLRRTLNDGTTRDSKQEQIVKMDWSGKVIDLYELNASLTGGFCIDADGGLYGITHDILEEEEVFFILKYDIR